MKTCAAEPSLFIALFISALSASLDAATIASDNAANSPYADGWDDGDDGGTGFGAWILNSGNGSGGTAGFYIGDTGLPGTDTSFGIFAGNDTGAFASATRSFDAALQPGQTFSFNLGHTSQNFGEIGMNLLDGAGVVLTLKHVRDTSDWVLDDGGGGGSFSSGQAFDDDATLAFSFTYNGGSSYSYEFGSGSGSNYTATNTISNITGFRFYSNDQGGNQNFGVNNLSVVPEPTNALIGGLCALGLLHRRRGSTSRRRTAVA